jgi:V/A-type H+/Na+-transporting ATPase subunit I
MFIPEKMIHIQAVFPARDVDAVAESVVRQGVLQMVDAAEISDWAGELPKAGTGDENPDMRSRRERLENTMKLLDLDGALRDAEFARGSWEDIDRASAEIEDASQKETALRDEKRKELNRLEALRLRAGEMPALGFPLEGRDAYTYLAVETGRVADRNLGALKSRLEPLLHTFLVLGSAKGYSTIVAVALKRDRDRLQAALAEAGFDPITPEKAEWMLTPEKLGELESKIDNTRKEIEDSVKRLERLASKHGAFLRSVLFRIRWESLKHTILRYFRKTDQTYVLSGWLPKVERESFAKELRKATSGRCVLDENRAEDLEAVQNGKVQVPVKLKNPAFIRPFELLLAARGTPEYRTIDPTPIMGLSFLIMFGLMFGDVGHGFVLAAAGLFLLLKSKPGTMRQAGLLVLYAGCSSMIFGFLFGSIFGFETVLPTLWTKPMESISRMFKAVIFFGAGLITVSVVLRMINQFRKRRFLHIVFDKAGVLGGVFYWCGIALASSVLAAKSAPPAWIPVVLLAMVVLLFFQEPIVHAFQRKKLFPDGAASGIMGGFIEVLETFLGYLANTVSFIRVAAFGLAHVGLFMAVFALADANKTTAGGAVYVLIQIVGNIGIIVLEGMVVSIQCVRLEFYEFLSRFFEQGDSEYKPFGSEFKGKGMEA